MSSVITQGLRSLRFITQGYYVSGSDQMDYTMLQVDYGRTSLQLNYARDVLQAKHNRFVLNIPEGE